MNRIGSLAAAVIVLSTNAIAYDFKGVSIGASEEQFKALTPGTGCDKSLLADRKCRVFNSGPLPPLPTAPAEFFKYGPTTLLNYSGEFFGDRLAYIQLEFSHTAYADMVPALTEKFGKPSRREVSKLQNKMGATYEGIDYTWTAGEQTVELEEYHSDLKSSVIRIRTVDFWAKVAAKRKETAKGTVGSM